MGDTGNDTLAELLRDSDSDNAANLIAGMHLAEPKRVDVEGVPLLVTPRGSQITRFDDMLDRPKRIKANQDFCEPQSYCGYVNEFNAAKTARIYADYTGKKFWARMDDHQPGMPSWREHLATLGLLESPEWAEWAGIAARTAKQPIDQQELAEFFEAQIRQIAEPDAGDLLTGIRNIQMANNWRCTSVQREGGDISFQMQRESSANTSVGNVANAKIPAKLTLMIHPYLCWNPYPLKVALTYRLQDEKIRFTIKLLEATELLDQAFTDIRAMVEKETGLKVFL